MCSCGGCQCEQQAVPSAPPTTPPVQPLPPPVSLDEKVVTPGADVVPPADEPAVSPIKVGDRVTLTDPAVAQQPGHATQPLKVVAMNGDLCASLCDDGTYGLYRLTDLKPAPQPDPKTPTADPTTTAPTTPGVTPAAPVTPAVPRPQMPKTPFSLSHDPWAIALSADRVTFAISLDALQPVAGQPGASWIQVAKTGKFQSARYGKFEITRQDLSQMKQNFMAVTPKAPTKLPVDYNHGSMAPRNAEEGKAAGWFQSLELRADGDELWALVDWTKPASEKIANREYLYVSPSFAKNHVHSDGRKIGTTLLAAALTNHPFLEGMQPISLTRATDEVLSFSKLSYEEKRARLEALLREKFPQKTADGIPTMSGPWAAEVWEDYFTYRHDGKLWKQEYTASDSGVELEGDAVEAIMQPVELAKRGTMATIKVKDVKGNEVEIDESALQGVKGETSIVVNADLFSAMGSNIEALSTKVQSLTADLETERRNGQVEKIESRLQKLSTGGFITKPERDWAKETFAGGTIDLVAFDKWASTKTVAVVKVDGKEIGSGEGDPAERESDASAQLVSLSKAYAKEHGVGIADAMIAVSAAHPDLAEAYRESFAE